MHGLLVSLLFVWCYSGRRRFFPMEYCHKWWQTFVFTCCFVFIAAAGAFFRVNIIQKREACHATRGPRQVYMYTYIFISITYTCMYLLSSIALWPGPRLSYAMSTSYTLQDIGHVQSHLRMHGVVLGANLLGPNPIYKNKTNITIKKHLYIYPWERKESSPRLPSTDHCSHGWRCWCAQKSSAKKRRKNIRKAFIIIIFQKI